MAFKVVKFLPMLLIATVFALGCDSKPKGMPELAPVSGTVTMDGQPLARAMVTFVNGQGVVSVGPTDEAGRYSLSYRGVTPGAGLGANKVTITSIPENPDVGLLNEPIPPIYNSKSTLSADVATSPNTFAFDLSAKPSKK